MQDRREIEAKFGEALREVRALWYKLIRPFESDGPRHRYEELFPPLPALQPQHVENCRVLVNREALIASLPRPPGLKIAEVGTQYGTFAERIIAICSPAELHVFDVDMSLVEKSGILKSYPQVRQHEGDSSTMLNKLPDQYFDWIYIDGDHSYEGVKRDIEAATKKLKPGGHLVFNDYIIWSHFECFPYGIPRAVHELCLTGWEMSHMGLQANMYCDVALRRIA